MTDSHFLKHTNLSAEANKKQLIYKNMVNAFNQQSRLLVLLDETLAPNIFDDLKKNFKSENIIYLPLAKGNSYKDTNLFFIEIVDKKILEKVWDVLAEHLLDNFEVANDQYLVHGFGTSHYDNEELNKKFKKSLVLDDIESKILFRWYDPRVMIYLDDIFSDLELNSLLGSFNQWQFIHPIGYFYWDKKSDEKFFSRKIYKLTSEQSIALDLIEISNLVFRESFNYNDVEREKSNQKNILLNLFVAHEEHKIHKYADLYSYGLYTQILGRNFFHHPLVNNILDQYWKKDINEYNFNEAMSFIDQNDWLQIKRDLDNLERSIYG